MKNPGLIVVLVLVALIFCFNVGGTYVPTWMGDKIADNRDVGVIYYPAQPGKQVVRDEVRKYARVRASEDAKKDTAPNEQDLLQRVTTAATHANQARRTEAYGFAIAEGRVVAEVTAITPTHLWTDTQKEVYTKTRVTVSGQMMGSTASGSALNKWSGPMGWVDSDVPDWLDKSRRLCPQFPYLAVVGRIETSDMNPYSCEGVFLVGTGTDITPGSAGGKLKLGLNEIVRNQFGGAITTHLTDNGGGFTYEVRPH